MLCPPLLAEPDLKSAVLREHAEQEARTVSERMDARPYHEVVAAMRAVDVCPSCGKTRVVLNVGRTRGFHIPKRDEHITPQRHCACPAGPVVDADQWEVAMVRITGSGKPRVLLTDPNGRSEPLVLNVSFAVAADWGEGSGQGALTLAVHLLQLVTHRDIAHELARPYADVLERLPMVGARLTLAEIRAWVDNEGLGGALVDIVKSYLDYQEFETLDAAVEDIATDVSRELRAHYNRTLSANDRRRLVGAVEAEWRSRGGMVA